MTSKSTVSVEIMKRTNVDRARPADVSALCSLARDAMMRRTLQCGCRQWFFSGRSTSPLITATPSVRPNGISQMYGGRLHAHPSVAARTITGLPHASQAEDMAATVMLLIDTTGCDMLEEEAGGGSRRNEREAEVTVQHVK